MDEVTRIMTLLDELIHPPMKRRDAMEVLDEIIEGCQVRLEALREEPGK